MAELKTRPTNASVTDFLNTVADERKRHDSYMIVEIMQEITQAKPVMWGDSIIGFGSYHYKYASGQEGDWPVVGFSPRKQNLTLYLTYGVDAYDELLSKLGKHKLGKSCLYIKKLDDLDMPTLKELIRLSVERIHAKS